MRCARYRAALESGGSDVIRMLVKHLVVCVALAVVVMVGLVAIGWTPRVEYFLAVAVATAVASTAVRMINESVEPAVWPDLAAARRGGGRHSDHVPRALAASQR